MRRQIPFKASIRQPIRTLIFVLLVGLASFGFVSRAVEYIILSREMNRIEQFYRTVGTLVPIDHAANNNVYEAVELIRGSRFIQVEDRRTITQGVMDGILNAMNGHETGGISYRRGDRTFAYKGLYITDAVAVIHVDRISTRQVILPWEDDLTTLRTLTLRVYDVLFGHDLFVPRQYIAEFRIDDDGNAPIDHLQEGGHYLARIIQQSSRGDNTAVDVFPLFDDVYFVSINDDEAMANAWRKMEDDIARLEANTQMLMVTGTKDMTALPMVQSGVYERFQGRFISYEDYLNANHVIVVPQRMDSTRRYARVGNTITLTLRDMRTFTDGAPMPRDDQRIRWQIPSGAEVYWANVPAGYWVSIPRNYDGDWRNYPTVEIEVEIVGTYVIPGVWNPPRWAHITETFQNMEVFVPASIIPEGWGIIDAHFVSGAYSFLLSSPDADVAFMEAYGAGLAALGFTVQFFGEDPTNFIASAVPIRNSIRINLLLFSAVLTVVLVLTVFLYLRQRYKEFAILRAIGMSEGNATWEVIIPVLIFWLPVVIAAGIGAWYFAFNQAAASLRILAELGTPDDYSVARVVRNILEQMRYEVEQAEIRAIPRLSMAYLVWLCAGLVVAWVGTVLAGTLSFASRSMISLIQGVNTGGGRVRAIKETVPPVAVQISDINEILKFTPALSPGRIAKSVVRHHGRHIFRAPVKSLLVVGMAMLFIIALGWLDRTIEFTEGEVERLYATTKITGRIIRPGVNIEGTVQGHEIPWRSLEILWESGYVSHLYTTALTNMGMFPPASLEMAEDENTRTSYHLLVVRDTVKTINCWDSFVAEAARPMAFGAERREEFSFRFAPGFGPEDLTVVWRHTYRYNEYGLRVYTTIMPVEIPIVVHESLLSRLYMIRPGDIRYMAAGDGYAMNVTAERHLAAYLLDENGQIIPHTVSLGDVVYLVPQWFGWAGSTGVPMWAVVIGFYYGGHPSVVYHQGQGMILVSGIQWTHSATATFTMYQEKIRYFREFEEKINERLTHHIHHQWYDYVRGPQTMTESFSHIIELDDEEFRMVVLPLEENLNLLRLLYPVAKIMSFVLALGLSLLLMLQNAKIVAILRILGSARRKTRLNLGMEQLAVCISGVAIGFLAVLVMGIGLATASMLVGIYTAGAAIGTIAGVLVISYKTPLELLQVKE